MPGPAPEPSNLRRQRGNPSHRPLNPDEPALPLLEGAVKPPTWLPTRARKHWRPLVQIAQDMRLLTTADLPALALLAQEMSIYVEANLVLERSGYTVESVNKRGAPIVLRRPEVAIAATSLGNIGRLMDRFGMTPAYRTKVHSIAEASGKPSALEELRARRGLGGGA